MSYILESLKKSDQERQEAKRVDATAYMSSVFLDKTKTLNDDSNSRRYLLWIFLLICVSVGVFLFAYSDAFSSKSILVETGLSSSDMLSEKTLPRSVLSQRYGEISRHKEVASLYGDNAGAPSEIYSLYQSAKRLPVPLEIEQAASKFVETLPVANLDPQQERRTFIPIDRNSAIPSIYHLEKAFQQTVPAIRYDAHIYSSNSKAGSVILNGVKATVGSQLDSGVYIEKIELEAVILSYQGVVFSLPAMSSWNN